MNGNQTAKRLCMGLVQVGEALLPNPASGKTAIRFDGVLSMEADFAFRKTPSARGMQQENAVSPLPRCAEQKIS